MRFEHAGGEKCFVDYSGQTLAVVDPETGGSRQAEVFVATFGASNYTFVDVTWSQKSEDFLASHQRGVEFFGGVPRIFVLDNLRSGVTKPDWHAKVPGTRLFVFRLFVHTIRCDLDVKTFIAVAKILVITASPDTTTHVPAPGLHPFIKTGCKFLDLEPIALRTKSNEQLPRSHD